MPKMQRVCGVIQWHVPVTCSHFALAGSLGNISIPVVQRSENVETRPVQRFQDDVINEFSYLSAAGFTFLF